MSVEQIVREIDDEIAKLTRARAALAGLVGSEVKAASSNGSGRKRRHVSAASRRKMAQAQKARWAKVKAKNRVG